MADRTLERTRKTGETEIELSLNLDGTGDAHIDTGIGFLDHMIDTLARHGALDLELICEGDLKVDDHHTAEDCAIVLGEAIDEVLGDRSGIVRFGSAFAPLDEALARTVIDLSGRPHPHVSLGLTRERLGEISTENLRHVLYSLGNRMNASMHVDVLKGTNDHHRVEAAFKSTALAIKQAVHDTGSDRVRSTKGSLGGN